MPDPIQVNTTYKLLVGSPSENYIAFAIKATEAVKGLIAEIVIPCGKPAGAKTFLADNGMDANLTRSFSEAQFKFEREPVRKITSLTFKTKPFELDAGGTVTIKIADFNPLQSGDASLELRIKKLALNQSYPVTIEKPVGPAILSLNANPANVFKGKPVTITATTVGAKDVKLWLNDVEVANYKFSNDVHTWTHSPPTTTTYNLKAWRQTSGEGGTSSDNLAQRTITVPVEPRDWYSWDLLKNSRDRPEGEELYPVLLLKAQDLTGETTHEKAYGIFIDKKTGEAGLWSSNSGTDNWLFLVDVPEGMGESPGVIHNQTLWLIGGSSADPLGNVSNRICWYYKDKDQQMVWKEWDGTSSPANAKVPEPRKCHACAVFGTEVWVLGGLSEQNDPLDDAWKCSADPFGGKFEVTWTPAASLPSKRCLCVATETPRTSKMRGVSKPRLWLCGGATHPYNLDETFYDLWWTEDGASWKPFALPDQKLKPQILSVALWYDDGDQRLHFAEILRGEDLTTLDRELADVNTEPCWARGSLTTFDWKLDNDLFLIRSIAFQKRWIFVPVYQNWDGFDGDEARIYINR